MTDMTIAAPLAAALAAKGYADLTAVQSAVLAADAAGRDLLVSARTGSGKTVAFGLAVAPDLLQGEDRLAQAGAPLALAIAPTRELALQVARELGWLYAEAGVRVSTCVGGMDFQTERRALERGAHIVVGTPGRLRDHIERRSLDLTAIRAAVLDEADEMLDLGFREDLEFILAAAPDTRRTLMFSATVPRAIAELARDFQRDALRIEAQGEEKQHVDITYRALSVGPRDREPAIFNLLRWTDARTAIIFCKTRANVNHLLARMGNRGFQAVALSGELSQSERTHALQALRDGRARVCIATDVAARGIDLPGLELVIHADLPTNPDTLLHRSGRTGRAGAKGVSALIVTPADYRKAQRILREAQVVAEWGKPPSADEVRAMDEERLMSDPILTESLGDEDDLVARLLDAHGAEGVAGAFVRLWRAGHSAPEELSEAPAPRAQTEERPRGDFGPSVWYALDVGHEGRAEARWLLPKICDAGSVSKDAIGAIRVQRLETYVQIAEIAAGRFPDGTELAPGLTMRRLASEPVSEARGAPPGRPAKPAPRPKPSTHRKGPSPMRDDAEGAPQDVQGERPAVADTAPRVAEVAVAAPVVAEPRPETHAGPRAASEAAPQAEVRVPRPRASADRIAVPAEPGDETAKVRAKPRWTPETRETRGSAPRADQADRPRLSTGYKSHDDAKPSAPGSFKVERKNGGEGRTTGYRGKDGDAKPAYRAKDGAPGYRGSKDGDGKPPYRSKDGDAKPAYRSKDGAPPHRGSKDSEGRAPYRAPGADGDRPAPRSADGSRPAKPYAGKPGAPKSAGFKSHGKPRAAGFKSHGAPKTAKPGGSAPPRRPKP